MDKKLWCCCDCWL